MNGEKQTTLDVPAGAYGRPNERRKSGKKRTWQPILFFFLGETLADFPILDTNHEKKRRFEAKQKSTQKQKLASCAQNRIVHLNVNKLSCSFLVG